MTRTKLALLGVAIGLLIGGGIPLKASTPPPPPVKFFSGSTRQSPAYQSLRVDGSSCTIAPDNTNKWMTLSCSGSSLPTQTGNSGKLLTTDGTNASWTSTITSPVISTGLTASGSAANDFSGSTGTFKTSSGANTLSGDTSMATGKKLTVNAALLATTGSAPTVAPTASAGSTATASIVSGNDQRFELTITASGTGIGAGQWATVTFANTWASTPYCVVGGSRYSSGAVDWTWYADHNASSTTQLVIGNNFNTIGAGTYYVIVICMG